MAKAPSYLTVARSYVGLKEIPGPKHNTTIQGWLKKLGAWWNDDETPWCGVFAAACMQQAGLPFPKAYYRAKEWATYGTPMPGPFYGAIAVLERVGGGHVAFVTGVSKDGKKLRLLGGNQGNMVNESWFDTVRVTAYRCPAGIALDAAPIAVVGAMSKSEA